MNENFLCRLDHRGVIRLSGADRRSFLQGLISNDIGLCQPGNAIYAALLTPQGKFLHDLLICEDEDGFLIDCEKARADDLIKRLAMYKLRADIHIENLSDKVGVWAANKFAVSPRLAFADPRHGDLGFRAIVTSSESETLSVRATAFAVYDRHRLRLGVADGSRDMIIGKSTLLECNLDRFNTISWTKGCYMGQELTARMHYRGLVKKRLYSMQLTTPPPAPQMPIYFKGQEIGDMRSSCGDIGLALLNIDIVENNGLTSLSEENFRAPAA